MNGLSDPYLPGAISLLEQIDRRMLVVLRDGRTLIGFLRTIDQFANLVLDETIERIHVDQYFGDIPRGIFIIRGDNVCLAGEIERKSALKQLPIEEVLALQKFRNEQKLRLQEIKNKALKERGMTPHSEPFLDETL